MSKTILYVDDDADDREFLCEALKQADPGVEVILAENGIVALDYLNSSKTERLPCLIVLDINMPFLDGKEMYDRIKKDRELNAVPVVIFSSSERPADKALFNDQGIKYFTKPSNITYLGSIASYMVNIC